MLILLRKAACLAGLTGSLLLSASALAQTLDSDEERKRQELEALQLELQQSRGRQATLARELEVIRRESEDLSRQLINLARQIQVRENRISDTEERIVELGEKESDLQADLAARRRALSHLLAGLQKLERNPPPPIATNPDDAVEAVRGAMLFATIVPQLRKQSAALAQALNKIDALRQDIRREQAELRDHIKRLKADREQIAALHARKTDLAEETDGSLAGERVRRQELARSADSLENLLKALERERIKRAQAEKRRLEEERRRRAEEEKRRIEEEKRLAAEERKHAEEARKRAEIERKKAEEEKKRLAALAARPKVAFSKSIGKLAYPAQGRKVGHFNQKNGFGGRHRGLFIATRKNAQVIAPADGKIEFAGPFRSYGKLLILDVDEGYHILIAGLEELNVQTGQFLRAGEPVGVMGEKPDRRTLINNRIESAKPILYIEFRENGKAIDPTPWWIGNRKEARR